MVLYTRDSIPSVPVAEVPAWVRKGDVAIEIGTLLTTLVVYDAGECNFRTDSITDLITIF